MSSFFNDLSFSFVMDLYRAKKGAVRRGDKSSVLSLQLHYPEIFTEEFDEFIKQLTLTVEYFDNKHGENFSSILEPVSKEKNRTLN